MNDPRTLQALADLAEQVTRIAAALEAQVNDDASAQQLAKLADLNRLLTEPTPAHLPGDIIVTPTEWSLWNDDRTVFYGLVTTSDDGGPAEYSTHYCGANSHGHPSLASAVAYLIQRQTERQAEETGAES